MSSVRGPTRVPHGDDSREGSTHAVLILARSDQGALLRASHNFISVSHTCTPLAQLLEDHIESFLRIARSDHLLRRPTSVEDRHIDTPGCRLPLVERGSQMFRSG